MLQYFDLVALDSLPSQRWIVEDVLPDQGLAVLYGMPGCGKTFVALDLALRVSNRMAWCGKEVNRPGIVIYVMAEGMCGIKTRINAWHACHGIHPEASFVVMPLTFNICDIEQAQTFMNAMDDIRHTYADEISLIIFDTFARVAIGLDENSSRDVSILIRVVDQIRDKLKCSVLFVHHGGKDHSRGMRGSSSLLGAVDTCIKATRYDGSHSIELNIEKQKDGSPAYFNMELRKFNDSAVVLPSNHRASHVQDWQAPQYRMLAMAIRNKDVYEVSRDLGRPVADVRVGVYRLMQEHKTQPNTPKTELMCRYKIRFANVLPARILAAKETAKETAKDADVFLARTRDYN